VLQHGVEGMRMAFQASCFSTGWNACAWRFTPRAQARNFKITGKNKNKKKKKGAD